MTIRGRCICDLCVRQLSRFLRERYGLISVTIRLTGSGTLERSGDSLTKHDWVNRVGGVLDHVCFNNTLDPERGSS